MIVMYIAVGDFFSNFCIWEGFIIRGHALIDWHVWRLFINHFWIVHISFLVASDIITIMNEKTPLFIPRTCEHPYIYVSPQSLS